LLKLECSDSSPLLKELEGPAAGKNLPRSFNKSSVW